MNSKITNRSGTERADADAKTDSEKSHKNAPAPIEIPHGADLENPPPPVAQKLAGFSDDIFNNLPDLLKNACLVLKEQAEKEVFLIGALGVISGLLPNVWGFYDTQFYGCNLYVYLLGAYGTGKGGLNLAQRLGMAVHIHLKELSALMQAKYKQDCFDAKDSKQPEPDKPGHKMLFIPADNSKSGLVELLADNEDRGILLETEGDTLSDALKTDYGGFSDVLRKAFHHEGISFFRRTGSEHREIKRPQLSVVLSSTFDQYQKLIPNIQNGLFSRFLHYNLTSSRQFKNVFDRSKRGYPEYFDQLGETFMKIYIRLEALTSPIEFDLEVDQKNRFQAVFENWKKEIGEFVSTDLDGTVNRLGLICFRLAMIFTALRHFDAGQYPKNLVCNDTDFENALRIVEVLMRHALRVYDELPHPAVTKQRELEEDLLSKAAQIAQSRQLWAAGKSYAEIAKIVLQSSNKKSIIWKWLNR